MPGFVVFAILSAIALGGYSVLTKILLRYRVCDAGLVTWGLGIATGIVSLVVLVFGRYPFPTEAPIATVMLAAIALVAHWFLSRALQEGDASTVVPLLSLKIPFVAVLSIFMLGERHTLRVYIAAGAAALGVAMFGIGRQERAQGGYGRHPILAIALACLSALSYALLDQLAKQTLAHTSPFRLVLWVNIIVACVCLIMLFRPHYRKYRLARFDLVMFLSGGGLMFGGLMFFFRALDLSDGVTIPNIVLSTRGFFALLIGFTLGQALKIPMERQSNRIYLLRAAGSVFLLAGLLIALL